MSNFLVLGAGKMADGIVHDLVKRNHKIYLRDISLDALDKLRDKYSLWIKAQTDNLAIIHKDSIPDDVSVVISTLPYSFNLMWSEECIRKGLHFLDLGGNNDVVAKQLALSKDASNNNVTIVPDCGLAPGVVSILAMNLLEKHGGLDTKDTYSIDIEVGGLPMKRDNELEYSIVFSANGLINEYIEPSIVLYKGKLVEIPSMTGVVDTSFPWGFNKLEKFYTSGGASTLPASLKNICRNVEYKTIRYPSHCEKMKFILSTFKHKRKELEQLLTASLPLDGPDVILLRVSLIYHGGSGCGGYSVIDEHTIIDFATDGLTAMARMTAFPAAIIAQALAGGAISKRGTLKQEELFVGHTDYMINQLKDRGISFLGDN